MAGTHRSVVVIGSGLMGRRIATVWLAAAYDVHIHDVDKVTLDAATTWIHENVSMFRERFCSESISTSTSRLHTHQRLPSAFALASDAWVVFEAVPEEASLKTETLGTAAKLAPPDALICTNASALMSCELLGSIPQAVRSRVLNAHYMLRLPEDCAVELMSCGATDPTHLHRLAAVLRTVGLKPFVLRVQSRGFIFNRVWAAITREVVQLLSEGVASPGEVDDIFEEMLKGLPGPCKAIDANGLDTTASVMALYQDELKNRDLDKGLRYLEGFVRKGWIGKGSRGLYDTGEWAGSSEVTSAMSREETRNINGESDHDSARMAVQRSQSRDEHSTTLYFLDEGLAGDHTPNDFLQAGSVLKAKLTEEGTSSDVSVLHAGQSFPDSIEVGMKTQRLYWTNMGLAYERNGNVMSCNMDGSDLRKLFDDGFLFTPKQLTIDQDNEMLYTCDREGMQIVRSDLEGKKVEVLHQTGTDGNAEDGTRYPVGIALDAQSGKVYWTQKGPSKGFRGRIFRAKIVNSKSQEPSRLSDIQTLFEGLPEPIDLALDLEKGHLYWTDRGEIPYGSSLNRCTLAAFGAQDLPLRFNPLAQPLPYEVLVRNLHEPIGLKVDQARQKVYVTELMGSVNEFNLDGTGRRKLYGEIGAFSGITYA